MKGQETNNSAIRTVITIVILALATLFSLAIEAFGVRIENIVLVYTVALIIIIAEMKSPFYGLFSTVVITLLYSFLFLDPKYDIKLQDLNSYVSLFSFLIVEIVVNTLIYRMQQQSKRSDRNERQMKSLFEFSQGLLAVTGKEIVAYGEKSVEELTSRKLLFCDEYGVPMQPLKEEDDFIDLASIAHEYAWCIKNGKTCGYKENRFPDLTVKILPMTGSDGVCFGAILVDCSDGNIGKDDYAFLLTLTSQLTLALDKERALKASFRGAPATEN